MLLNKSGSLALLIFQLNELLQVEAPSAISQLVPVNKVTVGVRKRTSSKFIQPITADPQAYEVADAPVEDMTTLCAGAEVLRSEIQPSQPVPEEVEVEPIYEVGPSAVGPTTILEFPTPKANQLPATGGSKYVALVHVIPSGELKIVDQ